MGLGRFLHRSRRGRVETEEEHYDDLREAVDTIDLAEYARVPHRRREAINYLDLSNTALERDAAAHAGEIDELGG